MSKAHTFASHLASFSFPLVLLSGALAAGCGADAGAWEEGDPIPVEGEELEEAALAESPEGEDVATVSQAIEANPSVVISMVYGGASRTTVNAYAYDFVELHNRGDHVVNLAGWSVQYASATGNGRLGHTSAQITPLSGTLNPGQFLIVRGEQGPVGTTALPAADITDTSPMSMQQSSGKVALARTAVSVGCNGGTLPCSTAQAALIVDLVGYGAASYSEGTPTPLLSKTTAAVRNAFGCADTTNNSADFTVSGIILPRNRTGGTWACLIAGTTP